MNYVNSDICHILRSYSIVGHPNSVVSANILSVVVPKSEWRVYKCFLYISDKAVEAFVVASLKH